MYINEILASSKGHPWKKPLDERLMRNFAMEISRFHCLYLLIIAIIERSRYFGLLIWSNVKLTAPNMKLSSKKLNMNLIKPLNPTSIYRKSEGQRNKLNDIIKASRIWVSRRDSLFSFTVTLLAHSQHFQHQMCGFIPTSTNSPAPPRSPTIQFTSDPIYWEFVSDSID